MKGCTPGCTATHAQRPFAVETTGADAKKNSVVYKGRNVSFVPRALTQAKKFVSLAAAKLKSIFIGRDAKRTGPVSAVIPGMVTRLDGVGLNRLTPVSSVGEKTAIAEEAEEISGSLAERLPLEGMPEAPPKPPRMDPLQVKRIDDFKAAELATEKHVIVETAEEIFGSAADQLFENHDYHQALPYEMPIYSRAGAIREGFSEEMAEVRFDAWTIGASDRLAKSPHASLIQLLDDGEKFKARLQSIGTRIGAEG